MDQIPIDCEEINQVVFGLFSVEQILAQSVCEINNPKVTGVGTVYDPKMGVMENKKKCVTCDKTNKDCSGHFGHIMLNYSVVHPLMEKTGLVFLKCFCSTCHRLLVTKDEIELHCASSTKYKRYDAVQKMCEKMDVCPICKSMVPSYRCTNNTQLKMDMVEYWYKHKTATEDMKYHKLMSAEQKASIFQNIGDEDVRLMGLNPALFHPKHLVITALPVLPPRARPYVISNGLTCDDDLTQLYLDVVKINCQLGNEGILEVKRSQLITKLECKIRALMDNSHGYAKSSNGRVYTGIRERLKGKGGRLRLHLNGKRVNFSGRTVIGPDPYLLVDEIVIPIHQAEILTVPVHVNAANLEEMNELINESDDVKSYIRAGKRFHTKYGRQQWNELRKSDMIRRNGTVQSPWSVEYQANDRGGESSDQKVNRMELLPDDVILRKDDTMVTTRGGKGGKGEMNSGGGGVIEIPALQKKMIVLEIGDVVDRKLKTGDMVLFNRQPTLHVGSMIAMRIRVGLPHNTIRMNLAATKTFNADFDGDEMNIHVPQTIDAMAELVHNSSLQQNIISCQAGKAIIVIVQDALLGVYLMTKYSELRITRSQFMHIMSYCVDLEGNRWTLRQILRRLRQIESVLRFRRPEALCHENNGGGGGEKKDNKVLKKACCDCLFTGRNMFSMILPEDFNYDCENDSFGNEDSVVCIRNGVLLQGYVNHNQLKGSNKSIIKILCQEYSNRVSKQLINNVQFLVNHWLAIRGFTVGFEDCRTQSSHLIQRAQRKYMNEAFLIMRDGILQAAAAAADSARIVLAPDLEEGEVGGGDGGDDVGGDDGECPTTACWLEGGGGARTRTAIDANTEIRILNSLTKVQDSSKRIAQQSMDSDNNFRHMVESGSKGGYINITQISAMLGQQFVNSRRLPLNLSSGTRCAPYYGREEAMVQFIDSLPIHRRIVHIEKLFESRGFVRNSFLKGLNVKEALAHHAGGREGLTDTAVKTAETGYIQRKMVKVMEDLQIMYDGTVRNAVGHIIQPIYGEFGMDPSKSVNCKGTSMPCDIDRVVDRFNYEHEYDLYRHSN